ncbi:AzlC family ABC transporter permease, partial [Devosia sp.]|uniref:AzlC family ABC transporter permease n=1 Tax=Devosia sp. TaxID=1871048 RepID=UPI00260C07FF
MAIGIAAWGLVAGVAMAKSGMGIALAIFMAVVVYAGSAQIAALPLISAGAPIWVVWATTICVSLRFMAFSFHYRPYFAHLPRRHRAALCFLMGDTNFGLFVRRFTEPVPGQRHEDYFLGSALVTFGVWQVAIITGIVAGHGIPASWGL